MPGTAARSTLIKRVTMHTAVVDQLTLLKDCYTKGGNNMETRINVADNIML